MHRLLGLCLLLMLLATPSAARAGAEGPPLPGFDPETWERAENLAREGFDKLLRSLDALRQAVPRYGMPYIAPDGSIVIPRQVPSPAVPPGPGEKPLRT